MKYVILFAFGLFLLFSGCKGKIHQSEEENKDSAASINSDTLDVSKGVLKTPEVIMPSHIDPRNGKFDGTKPQPVNRNVELHDRVARPYYIKGKLIHGAGGNIILDRLGIGKMTPLYTQVVNKDEIFDFGGLIAEPEVFQLRLPAGAIHLIVRPGDSISVSARLEEPGLYDVKGSLESLHLKEVYEILDEANHKKEAIDDKIANTKDKSMVSRLYDLKPLQYDQIDREKREKLVKLIKRIDTSFACLLAGMYLNGEEDAGVLEMLDKKFARYAGNVYYENIHEKAVAYAPFIIGHIPPEIISATPEGKTVRLTELKGKYVFLDFWASWCIPCLNEVPNLKKAYDAYHKKGFEILSISFDKDKAQWLNAISANKMNWINASDLSGFESPAAQTYVIQAIPKSYLLDRQGRIIARDLRGDGLIKKLAEVIH